LPARQRVWVVIAPSSTSTVDRALLLLKCRRCGVQEGAWKEVGLVMAEKVMAEEMVEVGDGGGA
jgi:hypothetical protein